MPATKRITSVKVNSTSSTDQTNVPVTFGQVFAPGDLLAGQGLAGLQLDVKATHPDGSVRHAVVSTILPKLPARGVAQVDLQSAAPGTKPVRAVKAIAKPLKSKQTEAVAVAIVLDGIRYSADNSAPKAQPWLAGTVATELHAVAPLQIPGGVKHPHLTARFATRCYEGIDTRVDVTVENAWAYEPNPQNFTYDVEVTIGGKVVYAKKGLTHLHHARWRKLFWVGKEPQIHVQHDTAYLIASRALPNYDQSVKIDESVLAGFKKSWAGAAIEPMGVGLAAAYMPTTGGRDDLGILPGWAVSYLLSMDARAKQVTLGTADLAGSWSIHYRDKNTDRPISVLDYPFMTILGHPGDTYNEATNKQEYFPRPAAGADYSTPYHHDSAHQPSLAYLPYLVTGDYYQLEEVQFWATWDVFNSNPGYRDNIKGLISSRGEVRAEAWSLRTLAEAAYITPDSDPLKKHFTRILTNNLDWYNTRYTDNPAANIFGVLDGVGAIVYGGRGIAPWQDDFFTTGVGHTAELHPDSSAKKLLAWKAKAPVIRMTEPMCWINGAMYAMNIRDSENSPIYTTIEQLAAANPTTSPNTPCGGPEMAKALGLQVGEMTGYSTAYGGYPSYMQAALSYSVAAGVPGAKDAWAKLMGRSVKPDYSYGSQFNLLPRV